MVYWANLAHPKGVGPAAKKASAIRAADNRYAEVFAEAARRLGVISTAPRVPGK